MLSPLATPADAILAQNGPYCKSVDSSKWVAIKSHVAMTPQPAATFSGAVRTTLGKTGGDPNLVELMQGMKHAPFALGHYDNTTKRNVLYTSFHL